MSKSRKTTQWSPAHFPGLRKAWMSSLTETQQHSQQLASRVHAAIQRGAWTPQQGQDHLDQLQGQRHDAAESVNAYQASRLWWATEEMTTLAVDASRDIPAADWLDVLPEPSGIIGFGRTLPPAHTNGPLTLAGGAGEVHPPFAIDALAWRITGQRLHIDALALDTRLGRNVRIQPGPMQQILTLRISDHRLSHDEFTDPTDSATIADSGAQQAISPDAASTSVGIRALLATVMTMIQQPGITDQARYDARTGDQQPAATSSLGRPTDVQMVDVRAPQRGMPDADRPDGGSGRSYHHRWIVRGHWRQQPYGPEQSLRRPQWIADYIKGPEAAPIKEREKVYIWRR